MEGKSSWSKAESLKSPAVKLPPVSVGSPPRSSKDSLSGGKKRRGAKSFVVARKPSSPDISAYQPLEVLPEEEFVIIPEEGSWKLQWDLIILALVVYSAVMVPFRIAFSVPAEDAWWFFEVLLSLMFIADLVINFFTAIWEEGAWVTDRYRIAIVYLRGWFWIDAPASLPIELLDLLPGDSSQLSFLRFLRLFRLLRLLKLLKLDQLIEQIEEQLETSLRWLRLLIMLIKVLFVGHFLGCMWFGISAGAAAAGENTWFLEYQKFFHMEETPTVSQYYTWSLYWALTTLTTVGYGDITPANDGERRFTIFALLIGALIFSFMLSQVGTLIASLDRQTTLIEEKLDSVKEYAASRRLPKPIYMKLTKHFKYYLQKSSVFDETDLLDQCPPALRAEVTHYITAETLGKLPLFKNSLDSEFQTELFPFIKPISFSPGDIIFCRGETSRELLFLLMGEVNVLGTDDETIETRLTPTEEIFVHANEMSLEANGPTLKIHHAGCFGELVLCGQRRANTHVAHTYCEALQLTKHSLELVYAKNPRATRRLVNTVSVEMKRKQRLSSLRFKLRKAQEPKGSLEWAALTFQWAWRKYCRTYLASGVSLKSIEGYHESPRERVAEHQRKEEMRHIMWKLRKIDRHGAPTAAANIPSPDVMSQTSRDSSPTGADMSMPLYDNGIGTNGSGGFASGAPMSASEALNPSPVEMALRAAEERCLMMVRHEFAELRKGLSAAQSQPASLW